MRVKFKQLVPQAVLPFYSSEEAAGMDVTAISKYYDKYGNVVYGTGLAVEIPEGFVCLIFPRSSNSKKDLVLSNSVGILDSDYRGELFFKFKPVSFFYDEIASRDSIDFTDVRLPMSENYNYIDEYNIGDRIGQIIIIPYPKIKPVWADKLSETSRGINGWGSTGN